jgi:1-phosphatidylinositol-4-phosphate 5-kinase
MAPTIFERLRLQWGVSNNEYQRSVGPESLLNQLLTGDLTALNEKCSTGKSGAFFYLTSDNKIFLKTLPKREFIFFTKIIQNYYKHLSEYPNTLIVRIFGLYKLKIYQNKQKIDTVYFISMENIFWKVKAEQKCTIEEVYDLKGSLYGRTGAEGEELKD